MYNITNTVIVGDDVETSSRDITSLQKGTGAVRVVDVVRREDLRRIRGRIVQPTTGWISLRSLDTIHMWVSPVDGAAPLRLAFSELGVFLTRVVDPPTPPPKSGVGVPRFWATPAVFWGVGGWWDHPHPQKSICYDFCRIVVEPIISLRFSLFWIRMPCWCCIHCI
jgi:hypothetical protein